MVSCALKDFRINLKACKLKNWEKLTIIFLSILGIINTLFSVLQGNFIDILSLLINLLIAYTLLFNKTVKQAFSKKQTKETEKAKKKTK